MLAPEKTQRLAGIVFLHFWGLGFGSRLGPIEESDFAESVVWLPQAGAAQKARSAQQRVRSNRISEKEI